MLKSRISIFSISFALLALIVSSTTSIAQTDIQLAIELNKLEQKGSACRLTLLIENRLKTRIKGLDFELALFDQQKRLAKLVAITAGSYPINKTRIRQFDLADIPCGSIARLLLNSITACDGEGLTPDNCLERTKTRSTTNIPLAY